MGAVELFSYEFFTFLLFSFCQSTKGAMARLSRSGQCHQVSTRKCLDFPVGRGSVSGPNGCYGKNIEVHDDANIRLYFLPA